MREGKDCSRGRAVSQCRCFLAEVSEAATATANRTSNVFGLPSIHSDGKLVAAASGANLFYF